MLTASGGPYTDDQYNGGPITCTTHNGNDDNTYDYTGAATYNASTCDCDNGIDLHYTQVQSGVTVTNTHTAQCSADGSPISNTQWQLAGAGCHIVGGGFAYVSAGTVTWTASSEDLETNAISRFQNANPWGSFVDVGIPPGDPCDPMFHFVCLQSSYQNRASINTIYWDYQEAQFEYTVTGLSASTNYTLTFDVYESLYSASAYSITGTISANFTSNVAGGATISGDVPITKGYDTYICNPVVS